MLCQIRVDSRNSQELYPVQFAAQRSDFQVLCWRDKAGEF